MQTEEDHHPIIIVTGANSGVGFGICQRLLFQLSQPNPPDSQPKFPRSSSLSGNDDLENTNIYPCSGLTLIMACRNASKGEEAKERLMASFEKELKRRRKRRTMERDCDRYEETFKGNLRIEIRKVDLAEVGSIFRFTDQIKSEFSYISHLICNAGAIALVGFDFVVGVKEILKNPVWATTAPCYYTQKVGELSGDGLGWAWQCNVFGHYVLYRSVLPLLQSNPTQATPTRPTPGRVIWMSSIEASPEYYSLDDYQLVKTSHSYEAAKYQMEVIANQLQFQLSAEGSVRHFIVHPGVAHTNISASGLSWFTEFWKLMAFYMARLLGSKNHTISILNAAISAVHVALVSLAFLPASAAVSDVRPNPHVSREPESKLKSNSNGNRHAPNGTTASSNGHASGEGINGDARKPSALIQLLPKFSSQTTLSGRAYVDIASISPEDADIRLEHGRGLVEKCEALYQVFCRKERRDV